MSSISSSDLSASSIYIQLLFHSAQGCPLSIDNFDDDLDVSSFSLSMFYLPKKSSPLYKIPIKAYRLTALNQFILDSNYEKNDEVNGTEPRLINADDIQAFPGGITYSQRYIVCFNMKIIDLDNLNFKIRVTLYPKTKKGNSQGSPFVCESFHTGRQFRTNKTGSITGVLLTDSLDPVGNVNFDYLITSPWPNYWNYSHLAPFKLPENDRPLFIGHRGSGCSYCINPSKYMENTISSFIVAGESGADFIELDVQLTRDKAVVVFHDFLTEAVLDMDRMNLDHQSRLEIPLRDLSHYQLIKNKFKHASLTKHSDLKRRDTPLVRVGDDYSIFPLIGEVMSSLPQKIGIDIEVKFPQQERSGNWELEGIYFERDIVVERVLDEVFENNKIIQRPIIFSSFDPGICIILRQKQNNYPVFFIITSNNSANNYMDVRSRDIMTAITFCLAEKLCGICVDIDPIIDDISNVTKMVHDNGLRFMTWGNHNNSSENIKKQKDCKVDGVIFDRIYDILPKYF